MRGDDSERRRDDRDHAGYLERKVDIARSSMRAGLGHSNDIVEAEFAARRSKIVDRA